MDAIDTDASESEKNTQNVFREFDLQQEEEQQQQHQQQQQQQQHHQKDHEKGKHQQHQQHEQQQQQHEQQQQQQQVHDDTAPSRFEISESDPRIKAGDQNEQASTNQGTYSKGYSNRYSENETNFESAIVDGLRIELQQREDEVRMLRSLLGEQQKQHQQELAEQAQQQQQQQQNPADTSKEFGTDLPPELPPRPKTAPPRSPPKSPLPPPPQPPPPQIISATHGVALPFTPDSPFFTEEAAEGACRVRYQWVQIQRVLRAARAWQSASTALSRHEAELADTLECAGTMAEHNSNDAFAHTACILGSALRDVSDDRATWTGAFAKGFVDGLERAADKRGPDCDRHFAHLNKTQSAYERGLVEMVAVVASAKSNNEAAAQHHEHVLLPPLRRKFEVARFDVVASINAAEAARCTDMTEAVVCGLYALQGEFHTLHDSMSVAINALRLSEIECTLPRARQQWMVLNERAVLQRAQLDAALRPASHNNNSNNNLFEQSKEQQRLRASSQPISENVQEERNIYTNSSTVEGMSSGNTSMPNTGSSLAATAESVLNNALALNCFSRFLESEVEDKDITGDAQTEQQERRRVSRILLRIWTQLNALAIDAHADAGNGVANHDDNDNTEKEEAADLLASQVADALKLFSASQESDTEVRNALLLHLSPNLLPALRVFSTAGSSTDTSVSTIGGGGYRNSGSGGGSGNGYIRSGREGRHLAMVLKQGRRVRELAAVKAPGMDALSVAGAVMVAIRMRLDECMNAFVQSAWWTQAVAMVNSAVNVHGQQSGVRNTKASAHGEPRSDISQSVATSSTSATRAVLELMDASIGSNSNSVNHLLLSQIVKKRSETTPRGWAEHVRAQRTNLLWTCATLGVGESGSGVRAGERHHTYLNDARRDVAEACRKHGLELYGRSGGKPDDHYGPSETVNLTRNRNGSLDGDDDTRRTNSGGGGYGSLSHSHSKSGAETHIHAVLARGRTRSSSSGDGKSGGIRGKLKAWTNRLRTHSMNTPKVSTSTLAPNTSSLVYEQHQQQNQHCQQLNLNDDEIRDLDCEDGDDGVDQGPTRSHVDKSDDNVDAEDDKALTVAVAVTATDDDDTTNIGNDEGMIAIKTTPSTNCGDTTADISGENGGATGMVVAGRVSGDVVRQGWLFKRSTGGVKRTLWKRRWFVLFPDSLLYVRDYSSLDNPVLISECMLATVRRIPGNPPAKHLTPQHNPFYPDTESASTQDDASAPVSLGPHVCPVSFELVSPSRRNYVLAALTGADADGWIKALQECTEKMLNSYSATINTPNNINNAVGIGGHQSPANSIETSQEVERQRVDSNETDSEVEGGGTSSVDGCADCGAPDETWASINLCVSLCIECSGIHRSLGVHISKVRSFALDSWTEPQRTLLATIGNAYANRIWEHDLGKQDGWTKPQRSDKREVKQVYIRAKYEWRGFLQSGDSHSAVVHGQERTLSFSHPNHAMTVFVCDDLNGKDGGDAGAVESSSDYKTVAGADDADTESGEAAGWCSCSLSLERLLFHGAMVGDITLVYFCMAHQADVNWALSGQTELVAGVSNCVPKTTVLHAAARAGHALVCELLLLNGATKSLEVRDAGGCTPLDAALLAHKVHVVEQLMEKIQSCK